MVVSELRWYRSQNSIDTLFFYILQPNKLIVLSGDIVLAIFFTLCEMKEQHASYTSVVVSK